MSKRAMLKDRAMIKKALHPPGSGMCEIIALTAAQFLPRFWIDIDINFTSARAIFVFQISNKFGNNQVFFLM